MPDGTLHLIAQSLWHSPAFIVGDRAALERLIVDLTTALQTGQAVGQYFPNDGEGFKLHIRCVETADMAAVPIGYTDELAREDWGGPDWMRAVR